VGGAGAYAQSQITSAQIRNNTITSADIKNKSISTADLSASAVRSLQGKQGPAGPAGPPGPSVQGSQTAGPQGEKGDKGDRGLQGVPGEDGAIPWDDVVGWFYEDENLPGEDSGLLGVPCDPGEQAISGGYRHFAVDGDVSAAYLHHEAEAFVIRARNHSPAGTPPTGFENRFEVYVDCVPAEGKTLSTAERAAAAERSGIRLVAGKRR
jgi:hypothetical protein